MVNSIVLKNASIIDGSGSAPYSGHLIIKENKINSIVRDGELSLDKDANVIDLTGKSVMPGLIDAHCHISFDEPRSNDELFFHRREGLAAIIAGTNALKVLQSGVTSFFDADILANGS